MAAQLALTVPQRRETAVWGVRVCMCAFVSMYEGWIGRGLSGGDQSREWVEGGVRLSDTKEQI